ncbi:MAG: NAD(P)H-dependent oxidoreductase [Verrucomicrobiota bacterium]
MSSTTPEQLLKSLQWRYATKQFDSTKKIPESTWNVLEEALVLSPSSFGLQPWKFFVVTDMPTRQKLLAHSWNQSQVVDCSHHVVFAIHKDLGEKQIDDFLDSTASVRGIPRASLDGYRGMMVGNLVKGPRQPIINQWAAHQAYIALGNFMTSAAVIGIDTCPMEGIDAGKYDEILGLVGTDYQTVVACAAGYRAETDKSATLAKVRYPKSKMIQRI